MKILFAMDEIWKEIYDGYYMVSNHGRVKRNKEEQNTHVGKILKQLEDRYGYLRVNLSKNGKAKAFLIHRLVLKAFIGPCPKGKQVNHIDGIKKNNGVWNLEYVTLSENVKHAYRLGLKRQDGENNNGSKLKKEDIIKIRKLYNSGKYPQHEIAKMFKTNQQHVSSIVRKKVWTSI